MNSPSFFSPVPPWTPPLELAGLEPIMVSSTRHIYETPSRPDEIIKIHKEPKALPSDKHWGHQLINRKRRFIMFSGILREFEAYLDHHFLDDNPLKEHIMPVHGLIRTDQGIGVLMEKAVDANGALAPTLRHVINSDNMNPERVAALNTFLLRLRDSKGLLGDLNLDNVVLAYKNKIGERFMLIDGLGERTWVPIQSWSTIAQRRQKDRFFRKVIRKLARKEIDLRIDGAA